MFDADHFKRVNDGHGHAVGDAVLQRVVLLMQSHCRGNDLVVRYGGEEFVLLFADTDAEGALQLAECDADALQDWIARVAPSELIYSAGVTERFEQQLQVLRQWLRDRVPDYMVPVRFIVLDRLPTTALVFDIKLLLLLQSVKPLLLMVY